MTLLAIDPGNEQSALVLYAPENRTPVWWTKSPNEAILEYVEALTAERMAIEMVASYGMAVGATVFETCVWAGRFIQAWSTRPFATTFDGERHHGAPEPIRVYRREVKLHLCGTQRAKDSNIRQALIDRYGPGRDKAVGKKATPGPLYGMKADCWSALAVAITATEASA